MDHTAVIASVVAGVGVLCLLAFRWQAVLRGRQSWGTGREQSWGVSEKRDRERQLLLRVVDMFDRSPSDLDPGDAKVLEQIKEATRPGPHPPLPARPSSQAVMQIFVTAIVLLASLYVLIFKPEAETSLKDFCYTSIGTIIGFWLKA